MTKFYMDGVLDERERILEIIEDWGTHKCGWGDDECDYINKRELKDLITANEEN